MNVNASAHSPRSSGGPLAGIRVVDFTTMLSGPYCTMMLADLGADVVKVEPPDGDLLRKTGPGRHPLMGPLFVQANRGKRSVCLDLKDAGAAAALRRIIDGADVMIHNMRPSAARRIGIDYETIAATSPALVYCAVVGFGTAGPYAELPAYDDVIQAASGVAAVQSLGADEPEYVRMALADKVAGLAAFGAVTAALWYRERTGRGQYVEVPMLETLSAFVLMEHLYGITFEPPTGSSGYTRVVTPERRPFRTADGVVSVVFYNDRHWRSFFELAGRPDLVDDERFDDLTTRTAHSRSLYVLVADVMKQRTTAEWLKVLRDHDVPAMEVKSPDELITDQHLDAVGFFRRQEHPSEGTVVLTRPPFVFSESTVVDAGPAPRLGEHTIDILRAVGCTDAEIADLVDRGVAPPVRN